MKKLQHSLQQMFSELKCTLPSSIKLCLWLIFLKLISFLLLLMQELMWLFEDMKVSAKEIRCEFRRFVFKIRVARIMNKYEMVRIKPTIKEQFFFTFATSLLIVLTLLLLTIIQLAGLGARFR